MIELKIDISMNSLLKKIESLFIDKEQIEIIMGHAALILMDEIDSYIEEYSKSNTTYRPLRNGRGRKKKFKNGMTGYNKGRFKKKDGKTIYGYAPALIDTGQYRAAWDVETRKDFSRIMGVVFNDKEYAKYIEDRYLIAHIAFDRCKHEIRDYINEELTKLYER